MTPALIALVIAVVFVASVAQSITGFGFALIAVPLLVAALDVRDVVVISAVLSIFNAALIVRNVHADIPWRIVTTMLIGSLAGMPLGLAVLLLAPSDVLRLGVGVISLALAALLIRGVDMGRASAATELAAGMASGALNTSTGMNGPPIVLYLQHRRVSPSQFRGTLSMFFIVTNILTLAIFGVSAVIDPSALLLALAALPAMLAGNVAGHAILHRLDEAAFRPIVLAMLAISASAAVASAAAHLAA